MGWRQLAAICALLVAIGSPRAQEASEGSGEHQPAPPEASFDQRWLFGLGQDRLDNDNSDWREQAITRAGTAAKGRELFATVRRTERFGEDDGEVELGADLLLNPNWLLTLEASGSPSHNVLPKYSGHVALGRIFESELILKGGYRSLKYTEDTVDLITLGFEREFERFYLAYEFGRSELGSEAQNSHSVELALKYGARSRAGLAYVTGSEAVRVGAGRIAVSDIRALALSGLHWFLPQWGISYTLGQFEQGDFYTRDGALLGLAYRF